METRVYWQKSIYHWTFYISKYYNHNNSIRNEIHLNIINSNNAEMRYETISHLKYTIMFAGKKLDL
jgi:hypothetical protein